MSTIESYGTSGSAPKGSRENPYTYEEYERRNSEGQWTGGYVENMGIVLPDVDVTSSMLGMGSFSDFWDSYPWLDPWWDSFGDDEEEQGGNSNDNMSSGGEGGSAGGGNGGTGNGGGNSGHGESTETNLYTDIGAIGYCYIFKSDGTYTIEKNHIGYHSIYADGESLLLNRPLEIINGDDIHGLQFIATFDVFVFLANHTNVEWAASYNEGGEAFINTIHNPQMVKIPMMSGYANFIHSHPSGIYDFNNDPDDKNTYVGMLRESRLGNKYSYTNMWYFLCDGKNGEIINVTKEVIKILKQEDPRF